jgi:hypothetical protein
MSQESAPSLKKEFIELANTPDFDIQDCKIESLYRAAESKWTDSTEGEIIKANVNGHSVELGHSDAGESGGLRVWIMLDGQEVFSGEDMAEESEELKEATNILGAKMRAVAK